MPAALHEQKNEAINISDWHEVQREKKKGKSSLLLPSELENLFLYFLLLRFSISKYSKYKMNVTVSQIL